MKDNARMHPSDLPSKRVHSASRLTRLDVAPNHRRHITLIIHETRIEVWSFVGVWGGDMGGATRERVFQEMEHAEKFALGGEHVIAEEASTSYISGDRGIVAVMLTPR